MRRIAILRQGSMMAAMLGSAAVGIAGFGETVPLALNDLADEFDESGYGLSDDRISTEAKGGTVKDIAGLGTKPSDAIRLLAAIIEESEYMESCGRETPLERRRQ